LFKVEIVVDITKNSFKITLDNVVVLVDTTDNNFPKINLVANVTVLAAK
jgi:flavorubredoxin